MGNRTWKDACCDAAWARVISTDAPRNVMDMREWLKGGSHLFAWENYFFRIKDEHRKDCIFWERNKESSFRAAFMKWLSDNEVK